MVERRVGARQRVRSRQVELLAVVGVERGGFVVELDGRSAGDAYSYGTHFWEVPAYYIHYTNNKRGEERRRCNGRWTETEGVIWVDRVAAFMSTWLKIPSLVVYIYSVDGVCFLFVRIEAWRFLVFGFGTGDRVGRYMSTSLCVYAFPFFLFRCCTVCMQCIALHCVASHPLFLALFSIPLTTLYRVAVIPFARHGMAS